MALELTQTHESVLLNPDDHTLDNVNELPYDQILKDPSTKQNRNKYILFDLHSSFDDLKAIKDQ